MYVALVQLRVRPSPWLFGPSIVSIASELRNGEHHVLVAPAVH
jgi:hypothetical protein